MAVLSFSWLLIWRGQPIGCTVTLSSHTLEIIIPLAGYTLPKVSASLRPYASGTYSQSFSLAWARCLISSCLILGKTAGQVTPRSAVRWLASRASEPQHEEQLSEQRQDWVLGCYWFGVMRVCLVSKDVIFLVAFALIFSWLALPSPFKKLERLAVNGNQCVEKFWYSDQCFWGQWTLILEITKKCSWWNRNRCSRCAGMGIWLLWRLLTSA